jgi:release factor glutamine methyltransferase
VTIHTALLQGTKLLEQAGVAAPRLTAEVLLAHAAGHERAWLFGHGDEELREVWWIHYGRYLHQRIGGQPTQQITGRQEFYGREFLVTRDVLIPRPETEHVIEAALAVMPERSPAPARILDIGTGSGAIAVTLALERTGARVIATDLSEPALRIAARNARRLGAEVALTAADLAAPFRGGFFDLVVCNPPYIPSLDRSSLQREVRDWEPELALYGGEDGLDVYRRLIPEAARVLRPGGWLVKEIGYALADAVKALLGGWSNADVRCDLAGLPRVISAQTACQVANLPQDRDVLA